MGAIVGAALVSHVPTLMLPEQVRRDLNGGEDTTLFDGLHALRAEKLAALEPDTIIVVDTHWYTTIEHIVASHDRRQGVYTSEELPRGMKQIPYDIQGDPELAQAWAATSESRDDTWITAIDDPHLPIHYPTINLLPFLQGPVESASRWVSASICQTGEPDDFLLFGQLLAQAVDRIDRRVVILASGGLSHRFWPLKQFRDHEGADPDRHIRTPEACAADRNVISMMLEGNHAGVLDFVPEFATHGPEGRFGHYLTMAGALGGSDFTAAGIQFGQYEAVAGTGQAHIWFDL